MSEKKYSVFGSPLPVGAKYPLNRLVLSQFIDDVWKANATTLEHAEQIMRKHGVGLAKSEEEHPRFGHIYWFGEALSLDTIRPFFVRLAFEKESEYLLYCFVVLSNFGDTDYNDYLSYFSEKDQNEIVSWGRFFVEREQRHLERENGGCLGCLSVVASFAFIALFAAVSLLT